MTHALSGSKQPVPLALALGTLGGAVLVATETLTTRGPLVLLPYTALILALLVTVRLAGWTGYRQRFTAAFLAFMTATVVLYVFIGAVPGGTPLLETSVWDYAWRLGLIAGTGGILSGAVAYVADLGWPSRG